MQCFESNFALHPSWSGTQSKKLLLLASKLAVEIRLSVRLWVEKTTPNTPDGVFQALTNFGVCLTNFDFGRIFCTTWLYVDFFRLKIRPLRKASCTYVRYFLSKISKTKKVKSTTMKVSRPFKLYTQTAGDWNDECHYWYYNFHIFSVLWYPLACCV